MRYIILKKAPFYLPFRKADDTPSPALSRPCGRRLQLRPWRLVYCCQVFFIEYFLKIIERSESYHPDPGI